MATTFAALKDRQFIGLIGDEVKRLFWKKLHCKDTVTGLLLAGIGHIDSKQKPNFLVVTSKTTPKEIIDAFSELTTRKDIAVVLINQHVAESIRDVIDNYHDPFPTILEIPSKEHPYDPEKDSILKRVKKLSGAE